MPISQSSKILAADFNQVVSAYEQVWGNLAAESGFLWSHTDKTLHKFGWGQSAVEPVVVGNVDTIEAEHLNRLVAQVNAGLYHLDTSNPLLNKYAVATQVTAANMATVQSAIASVTANKFALNDQAVISIIETESAGCSWNESLSITVKYAFADYHAARHFFNAGGKMLINMDAIPDVMCPEAQYWETVLNQLGDVTVGAETTASTGTLDWQSQISNLGGFYDIDTTGAWTKLSSYMGVSYDLYSGISDYNNTQYATRVMELFGQVVDGGPGDFGVYLRVVLTEDAGEIGGGTAPVNGIIEADFSLDAGYVQPTDAPSDAYLANVTGASFKAGAYTYQFQEITAPTVTIAETWQSVPVAGTILSEGCVIGTTTYRVITADGSGGTIIVDTPNAAICGDSYSPGYIIPGYTE
jgi:hypothetical protein